MSDCLHITCIISTERGPAYWWPILCDVLSTQGMSFHAPDTPLGTSGFTLYRYLPPYTGDREEVQSAIGTCKDMWDEVSREVGSVTATFWFNDQGESCSLDVSSTFEPDKQQIALVLSLPGGWVRDVAFARAHQRLQRLFACTKCLYEVCQPQAGELYWEDSTGPFAPWACVGERVEVLLEAKTPEPYRAIRGMDQQVKSLSLGGAMHLFYFDPAPLWRRQGWAWISF